MRARANYSGNFCFLAASCNVIAMVRIRVILIVMLVLLLRVPGMAQSPSTTNDDDSVDLKQRAQAGDAEAQNELGRLLQDDQKYGEAVKWFRRAAKQGLSDAQVNMGFFYTYGLGVEKDFKEAFRWYALAAAQGDSYGEVSLGTCYLNGDGVPRDWTAAMKWFLRSFNHGNEAEDAGMAANGIGLIYEMRPHKDEKADSVEAFRWYLKGAELGLSVAKANTCRVAAQGLGGMAPAYQEALKWCLQLAESDDNDNVYGQTGMGNLYEDGHGVPQDFKIAADWYKRAAEHGDTEAQVKLATLYLHGQGLDRDLVQGYVWAKIADSLKDPLAMELMRTLSAEMSPAQLSAAEELATKWINEHPRDPENVNSFWFKGKEYKTDRTK